MVAPKIISDGELKIFNKYLPLLKGASVDFKDHDLDKINKIDKYYKMTGKVTEKQFRSFRHYCRIYDVKIPNSLIFILED